mmetsp:Transcript_12736/g.35199  ORF Transcript_12736/g.35199 Transcript_12736/m.35199 type:complete len:90 (+) Transcript_12736:53-322(+)
MVIWKSFRLACFTRKWYVVSVEVCGLKRSPHDEADQATQIERCLTLLNESGSACDWSGTSPAPARSQDRTGDSANHTITTTAKIRATRG